MKPFAYRLVCWSYDEEQWSKTTRTLRAAVTKMWADAEPSWLDCGKLALTATYEDDKTTRVRLTRFCAKVRLDMEAIRAEARAAIVKDAKAQADMLKRLNIQGSVTGSPWLCDIGEDAVAERLVSDRQWRWKTEDEVDWAALEAKMDR